MNPLDRVGAEFALSLTNPNPKAARLKDGPRYRVEFEVDAEAFEQFMSCRELSGMVIEAHCVVAALNEPFITSRAPAASGPAGGEGGAAPAESPGAKEISYAQSLHIRRYWHNPRLWTAMENRGLYTQKEHKSWIESQPCIGLKYQARDHACTGDVCAHHTSSAALPAAGKGSENPRKPPHWYTVPACHVFHTWCHSSTGATREDKQRLLEYAVSLAAGQIERVMKTYIGNEEGEHLTVEQVVEFEREIGLQ